jgi:UDP-N-acetylmuramoylalanine--D-glutamate ligase
VECVGRLNDIEFINDSKATNVDATEKSLLGFPFPVALILGGKDKGGDFARLLPLIEASCALVMLIGQASDEIARQLSGSRVSVQRVSSLEEAVRSGAEAIKDAGGQGTVLLSPACASFDMFKNFEDRGDQFRLQVREYLGG